LVPILRCLLFPEEIVGLNEVNSEGRSRVNPDDVSSIKKHAMIAAPAPPLATVIDGARIDVLAVLFDDPEAVALAPAPRQIAKAHTFAPNVVLLKLTLPEPLAVSRRA
jgi:hypothetical protein